MNIPFVSMSIAALAGVPAAALAQPVHIETPAGQDRTASLGDPIWTSRDFQSTDGVQINASVYAEWSDEKIVRLPAGSELVIIRNKHLKACAYRTETHISYFDFTGWKACLIDEDGDGAFEKVTARKLGDDIKLQPQVPYVTKPVPLQGDGAWAQHKKLTYLGVDGGTLRLAYREFSNNYIVPDFTDEFTIPVPASFPASFTIKGRKLTLLGLDTTAIRYRLD